MAGRHPELKDVCGSSEGTAGACLVSKGSLSGIWRLGVSCYYLVLEGMATFGKALLFSLQRGESRCSIIGRGCEDDLNAAISDLYWSCTLDNFRPYCCRRCDDVIVSRLNWTNLASET
jgi:hypothetical protein